MGIQAVREPAGLHAGDGRCPDLQLVMPGRHVFSDVCVTHPLAPSTISHACATLGAARHQQRMKRQKYADCWRPWATWAISNWACGLATW